MLKKDWFWNSADLKAETEKKRAKKKEKKSPKPL